MLDDAFGDDLDHELVGVVDALAAVEAQPEGKRRGEVVWIGGARGVGVGRGSLLEVRTEQECRSFLGSSPNCGGGRDQGFFKNRY